MGQNDDMTTTQGAARTRTVLSVRSPWCHLIMSGEKDVECRAWRTNFRGTLAIHAAATVDREGARRFPDVADSPRGAILGTVELLDCVRDFESPWAVPGAFLWLLGSPRRFETPIAATGRLGLWKITI
jgi:hypothetical protein